MKYRVENGPFGFGQGFVLRLTEEQAGPRMHRLQRSGDEFMVIDKPVEFKTGEIVEVIAGDIGRGGQDRLVALDAPPKVQPADRDFDDSAPSRPAAATAVQRGPAHRR